MKEKIVKKVIVVVFFIFLINFSYAIDYQKDQFKLTLNPHILSGYLFSIEKQDNTTKRTNTFYIPRTYLDFKLEYENIFYGKVYFDIAGKDWYSYDLYVALTPTKETEVRLGKFKQLLGYEIATSAHKVHFVEGSLISSLRSPVSTRDFGLGFFHKAKMFEINLNLVNGTGRTEPTDDNEWKDVSGRFILKPIEKSFIGANFYYGKKGVGEIKDLLPYLRLGLEAGYTKSPFTIIFEYLIGREEKEPVKKPTGFYGILGYQIDKIQPIFRFDFRKKDSNANKEWGLTFGLNYFVYGDNLKVMPNIAYYKYAEKHTLMKLIFQLQGYF
ncbi:MAG: porin [candidate division WOR-3 bacterium]